MSPVSSDERKRQGRRNRRHGAQKERDTVKWYREQGFVALHNTKGPFDVMAARNGELHITEVKSGKRPYDNYPPAERALTIAAAEQAGGQAYLAHWKPYASSPDLIPASQWPTKKESNSDA